MLLDGKIVWITGASKGIGRSTAELLAANGAQTIISGRNQEELEVLSAEITNKGFNKPLVLSYDVSNYQEIKASFAEVAKRYKALDVMVNNAGILEEAMIGMFSQEQLNRLLGVNVNGVLNHMQLSSRLMSRNKSGSIINLSSIIGSNGKEGLLVYSASKAAVIGATLTAAKELAPLNIRVNAVAPGFIETDMVKQLSPEKYKERITGIKMKRVGQPIEVANTILFLASEMSSYVTGQIIGVNGGMLE
jgi:3-oxoacyl-[acyl-carrier protein] reductase